MNVTGLTAAAAVRDWFGRRSYEQMQFADLDSLARRKHDLGLTVTVVLPAREVAGTLGGILDEIAALRDRASLVDQVAVIDARSRDGSGGIARRHGVDVYVEDELMPSFGPVLGKGDAMWRALSIARGDLVVYLDSDTDGFGAHFVYGLLGPLLSEPDIRFVKGAFSRPWSNGDGVEPDGGGRVTELAAKPLLNLFHPLLAGFAQPLAGEVAASSDLLRSMPFLTGYAAEAAMLIEVLEREGLDAMAQVDLGSRANRHQPLHDLGPMAYVVARAIEGRRRDRGAETPGGDEYLRALRSDRGLQLERTRVAVVERPPMAQVPVGDVGES